MNEFDAIVLGQGLAGSAVAWSLQRQGCRVLVIDEPTASSASRVAAGLVTPITGQRLARSADWDHFWPTAAAFYESIEQIVGQKFWTKAPMVRLLVDDSERTRLQQRLTEPAYAALLTHNPASRLDPQWYVDDFGSFSMSPAARLLVGPYLAATRRWFEDRRQFLEATVDVDRDFEFSANGVSCSALKIGAPRLILCQGLQASQAGWTQTLEFQPARGDLLTVRIPGLSETRIVHKQVWLARKPDAPHEDVYQVGATYDWTRRDLEPSPAARTELLDRLKNLIRVPVEVLEQRAAIRPILKQQRPVFGRHPQQPHLAILNGLGSKGVLQAPWLATQLAHEILRDVPSHHPYAWSARLASDR